MSSFQASSTLYSPEYYKSGHSVDQNMYIVNTSHNYGHTGHTLAHTYDSVRGAHALTPEQKHKKEQEEHRRHEEQVRKRHEAMVKNNHEHRHPHAHPHH